MPIAILSVYEKTGLIEFARGLSGLGWSFLASGGTAGALRAAGIEVEEIAAYTGAREILGGRVKTLHPAIHGGILARSSGSDLTEIADLGAQPGWTKQVFDLQPDVVRVKFRGISGGAGNVKYNTYVDDIKVYGEF